jgi:hypothetical protein
VVVLRPGGARTGAGAACPEGYSPLTAEGSEAEREREAALGGEEAEREREAGPEREVGDSGERGGKGFCLKEGVRRPEPFKDLMNANRAPLQRMGFDTPRQYTRAIAAKRRLRASGIKGTAGTWTPVGQGPVIFDDPAYTNTNGLANGLSRAAGRITDYAYDDAAGRLFAAVANGGVWMSTDRGASWTSIGETLPTQIVGAVGWSPAAGGTLIALTGDNAFGGNTYAGAGIYWSTDLGKTWHKAKGAPDGAQGFRVAVQPDKPEVVYAATGFGLYRSTDAGRSWEDVALPTGDCVGQSTSKKGCFFANVVTDVRVMGADGFGHEGGAVAAAVGWRAGNRKNPDGSVQAPGNGIYTSATGAKGSFARTISGFAPQDRIGRVALGAATGPKQNHAVLYALVQDAVLFNTGKLLGLDVPDIENPILGGNLTATPTYLNGVYVSKDFGKSWSRMALGEQFLLPTNGSTLAGLVALGAGPGLQAWYDQFIEPDPYTQSGGVPTRLVLGLEEVYESRTVGQKQDGLTDFTTIGPYSTTGLGCVLTITGQLCSQASKSLGTTVHPDQHAAIFLPGTGSTPTTLVIGNDGGAYTQAVPTASRTMTPSGFGAGNVKGFNTLLPYSLAVAKDGTVYSGLQDNGTVKVDPKDGRTVEVYGGDGTYVLTDPEDANQALYAPAGGSLAVTHDGGKTNTDVVPGDAKALQFLTPFVFDDTSTKRVIFGARNLFVADKAIKDITSGDDFKVVYDLGTAKSPGKAAAEVDGEDDADNVATALAMRDGVGYAGFCGSCDPVKENKRFKNGIATNVGGTWHIAAAKGLAQRLISALAIDPSDPKVVYAALGESTVRQYAPANALGDDGVDAAGGHVYKSTDGGETFTDISGDLPDIGATSLLVRGAQLVVGTTVGAFASAGKDGGSWGLLGDNLPAAPVYAMQLAPGDLGTLYIASYGRGLWRYGFKDPASACRDASRPASSFTTKARTARASRRLRLAGRSSDKGCGAKKAGKVRRVAVSIAKVSKKKCRYLRSNGRLAGKAESCAHPRYLRAKGTSRWSFTAKRLLPKGTYRIRVRATDAAGNVERGRKGRNARTIRLR